MVLLKTTFFAVLLSMLVGFSQDDSLQQSMQRGKETYQGFCLNCHLPNGEGIAGVYPPLAASDYLLQNIPASIRAVKYGMEGEIIVNGITYNSYMAEPGLLDEEVADVMNYILNSWGNKGGEVTLDMVKGISK